jgi:hypothetical protein
LVPIKRPSSEPLPLVFAVATTLKPDGRFHETTDLLQEDTLTFQNRLETQDLIGCKVNLIKKQNCTTLKCTSITGPLCHAVSPFTRRKPPIRSSSSVSIVMLTRISSRPN